MLLFLPHSHPGAVGRDCVPLAPGRVGLRTAQGLRGSLSHGLVVSVCAGVCARVPWPGNAQAGVPIPGPSYLQGVPSGLLVSCLQPKSCRPHRSSPGCRGLWRVW